MMAFPISKRQTTRKPSGETSPIVKGMAKVPTLKLDMLSMAKGTALSRSGRRCVMSQAMPIMIQVAVIGMRMVARSSTGSVTPFRNVMIAQGSVMLRTRNPTGFARSLGTSPCARMKMPMRMTAT